MKLLANKVYKQEPQHKLAETINFKISKRNLPNVGMTGWLTKYTYKESTFHNIATFHTTILQPSLHK